MSASMSLFSEFDRLRIECDDDQSTVWIHTRRGDSVALNLSRRDRDALRAALDQADRLDVEAAA